MGRFSEALRQETEAHEAEVCAAINGLDETGLVEWCKKAIDRYEKLFDRRKWDFDPFEIIRHSMTTEDQEAVLAFAREYHEWRADLIQFAKQCRRNGIEVPELWRLFLRNVADGTESKPDERGLDRKTVRDEAMCRCIQDIASFTEFKASRTGKSGKACGISIVAEAKGIRYYTVETVWKRHRKQLKNT